MLADRLSLGVEVFLPLEQALQSHAVTTLREWMGFDFAFECQSRVNLAALMAHRNRIDALARYPGIKMLRPVSSDVVEEDEVDPVMLEPSWARLDHAMAWAQPLDQTLADAYRLEPAALGLLRFRWFVPDPQLPVPTPAARIRRISLLPGGLATDSAEQVRLLEEVLYGPVRELASALDVAAPSLTFGELAQAAATPGVLGLARFLRALARWCDAVPDHPQVSLVHWIGRPHFLDWVANARAFAMAESDQREANKAFYPRSMPDLDNATPEMEVFLQGALRVPTPTLDRYKPCVRFCVDGPEANMAPCLLDLVRERLGGDDPEAASPASTA